MSQLVAAAAPQSAADLIGHYREVRRRLWPAPRFAASRPVPWPAAALVEAVQQALDATPIEPPPPPLPPLPDSLAVEVAAILAATGKRVRVIDVLVATAAHFKVRKTDILGHRRTRALVVPRHVAFYLAREHTGRSLPEIGRLLGGRDHTSVLHACRRIAALIEAGDPIKDDVDAIRARLGV